MPNKITINGKLLNRETGLPIEPEMLAFAYRVAARWPGTDVTINTDERVPDDAPAYKWPGQIEWGMDVRHSDDGHRLIFMSLLQRTKTASFESHS